MPWVSNLLRESQRERKESSETFCAPRTLGKVRTVPWASNLLTEFQQERMERLFSLVPPHVPVGVQLGYDLDDAFRKKNENKQPEKLFEGLVGGCQMPLARCRSCQDCIHHHLKFNCPKHMKQCNAPAWHACASEDCLRFLCCEHTVCYCVTGTVGRR